MPFPHTISAYTPTMPVLTGEIPGDLRDLAMEVNTASSRLSGRVADGTRCELVKLLRSLNSYYSNLIEGHHTKLYAIEKALYENIYDENEDKRKLQKLAIAHIETEKLLDARLVAEPRLDITSSELLLWIHREFYERMPAEYRFALSEGESEEVREVIPGTFRDTEVTIGKHYPPTHSAVDKFLEHFQKSYCLDYQHGDAKYIAAAASHHRLVWVHPFLDGNGRVARLFTHAYFSRITGGDSLWSISRGLARHDKKYKAMLAKADLPRQHDLDGRGALSGEGLASFCRFFLETALDQVTFMEELLRVDKLRARVYDYAERRSKGLLPRATPIREEAARLLVEVTVRGEVKRGEVQTITGLGERVARELTSTLINEKLLVSDSHRAPLRLGMPLEVLEYYFPSLYTEIDE